MGSPSWRHADSVTMTNGSDVVTGSGTDWVTGAPVVLPGFALSVDGIYYEIVEVRSDTELQIYPAYAGTTGAKTVTIIEFGRQGIEGAKKRLADVLQTVPAAGRQLYVGSGAPSSGLGNDGSLMVDIANAVLYGPKSGGAWPAGVSLRGPEKRRNLIIDGRGQFNSAGYASGTPKSGSGTALYTLDMWKVGTSGTALSWTETAGTKTFTAPAGTATTGGVVQVIEGANIVSGTYVVSWTGNATCSINGTVRANGATFTLTGGDDVSVRFYGGAFSLPQIEPGTVVTAYEQPAFNEIQAQVQRYYHRIVSGTGPFEFVGVGFYNSSTNLWAMGTLPVPMRAEPTFGFSALSDLDIEPFDVAPADIFFDMNEDLRTYRLSITDPGARSTGTAGGLVLDTVGGWIQFDARL